MGMKARSDRSRLSVSFATVFCIVAATTVATGLADDPSAKPYDIVAGKVDSHTFNGYLRYGESCLRCHGPDGSGSSYAPDLTDSLKTMSYDDFTNIVMNGKKDVGSGREEVMPAFGYVQDVATYIDDIYAYLKARSDGALGRGRPPQGANAN